MLRRFDGSRSPDEVHDHIRATLATKRLEDRARVVIHRKTPEEIEKMAAAGRVLVRCHEILRKKARPGVTTAELDEAAERFIRSQGAEPAFKGYRGFPGSICASPNSMVVHGIPGSYQLQRGDILSVDIGVVLDGWVADAAITAPDRQRHADRQAAPGHHEGLAVRRRRAVRGGQPPRRRLARGPGARGGATASA